MGSKFYLTLKWLLKFDTIAKILRGEYESFEEIKKREAERWNKRLAGEMEEKKEMEKMELLTKSEEGLREIRSIEEPQRCKTARFNLFMKIGYPSYKDWFKEVKFVEKNEKYGKYRSEYEEELQILRDRYESAFEVEASKLSDLYERKWEVMKGQPSFWGKEAA